jgi:agmatine deiminase
MKYLGKGFPSLLILLSLFASSLFGVQPDKKLLPIHKARHELFELLSPPPLTVPPKAPVRSLGEWEESSAAMTLWINPSLVRELSKRGPVKLFADGESDKNWWLNWMQLNGIPSSNISFFIFPTDSIWIRDYGPWPIIDGEGKFAFVHGRYNRPRPNDDRVSEFLSQSLSIPLYRHGLVHTGGNYYSDALGNAFSSTLVFTENPQLDQAGVRRRMKEFLGIDRYTTSPLGKKITIEHLDTFGKLVSPDTWVFSDFPQGTSFKSDSDKMVAHLKTLKSPWGTPYKIHRLKMTLRGELPKYRAYINSFISNRTLYFPAYGDAIDNQAKKVYQSALPGYEIVGVDARDTVWGDSVHCRNRNLLKTNTSFLFPFITQERSDEKTEIKVELQAIPTPGATWSSRPVLRWWKNGLEESSVSFEALEQNTFVARIPSLDSGTPISLVIETVDSSGTKKSVPIGSPEHKIEMVIE